MVELTKSEREFLEVAMAFLKAPPEVSTSRYYYVKLKIYLSTSYILSTQIKQPQAHPPFPTHIQYLSSPI